MNIVLQGISVFLCSSNFKDNKLFFYFKNLTQQYQRAKKGRICLTKVCSWDDKNINKAMYFLKGKLKSEDETILNEYREINEPVKSPSGSILDNFFRSQFKRILVYMYAKRQKNYD